MKSDPIPSHCASESFSDPEQGRDPPDPVSRTIGYWEETPGAAPIPRAAQNTLDLLADVLSDRGSRTLLLVVTAAVVQLVLLAIRR